MLWGKFRLNIFKVDCCHSSFCFTVLAVLHLWFLPTPHLFLFSYVGVIPSKSLHHFCSLKSPCYRFCFYFMFCCHPAVLRAYSRLSAYWSLLAVVRRLYRVPGIKVRSATSKTSVWGTVLYF